MSKRGEDELTAREAAEFLGIKLSSLYTYVSRGVLHGVRRAGHRGRLYPFSELQRFERLRSDGRPETHATRPQPNPDLLGRVGEWPQAGPKDASQAITEVLGLKIEDLAEQLWTGQRAGESVTWNARGLGLMPVDIVGALPPLARPLDCLPLAIAGLAARDLDRFGSPPEAELYRARRLCLRLAALLAMGSDVSRCSAALRSDSLAGVFLAALDVDDRGPRRAFVDAALGLSALQPAGAADEVVALATGAGADLYSSLLAGLALLSGPGGAGACGRIDALLAECEAAGGAAAAVGARLRRGDEIPGFGDRSAASQEVAVSGAGLLAALRSFDDADPSVDVLGDLVDFMANSGRGRVRLPVVLVGVQRALALPVGSAEALLVLGRLIPWVGLVIRARRRA